jgi:tRNA (guanine37-N1)-methyltransferase
LDGVIKKGSLQEESFTGSLLEYRQYTRPAVYQGMSVPEVLTSGNHKEIEKFKLMDSIRETLKCRPDLFDNPECYRSISERYQGKESIESLINKIKRELNDVSDNKNGTNTY